MFFGSLLSLALPLATLGASLYGGATYNSRDQELAKRQPTEIELHKRVSNSRWSFYDVTLGACGLINNANDFVVALNAAQFGSSGFPGPNCFKPIRMTYKGKTTQAIITDKCTSCPYGGLDLSRGLFRYFAPESAGIIYGEWEYV